MAKSKKVGYEPGEPRVKAAKSAPYDYTSGSEADLPTLDWGVKRKLTPDAVENMRRRVLRGVPIPTAATALGYGGLWRRWGTDARKHEAQGVPAGWGEGESAERMWLNVMDQARAEHEAQCVERIYEIGQESDWKALAWVIERRHSRRWHLQHKLSIINKNETVADISTMSISKLIDLARGLVPGQDIKVLQAVNNGSPDITDAEILDEELEVAK